MGPRLEGHNSNIGISATDQTISGTSRIYQRKKEYSMDESSSSAFPSFAVQVEASPEETVDHNRFEFRILMASESQSSLASRDSCPSNVPQSRQSTISFLSEKRPRLLLAWSLHFASCILILFCGSRANQGKRKYIPIDVNKVKEDCHKAFVDVFSSSIEDTDAFVCCRLTGSSGSTIQNPTICNSPPLYLPFARRLARFPDAWLLPLFPLMIRGCWQLFCNSTGKGSLSKLDSLYARRRLYLYLGLIQIRGWILYLAFDELEDLLVTSPGNQCWYEEYLLPHNHQCQGQMLDFSDHVVLYFAQILPIALVEILHSFSVPYWVENNRRKSSLIGHDVKEFVVPVVLILWLANLYVVTFLGAYKTAAYFHTGPEVFMGFLVSLLVQIPISLLQCTSAGSWLREYFFGPHGP